MTLEDFRDLFVDHSQLVMIYDGESESIIYDGELDDLPDDLLYEEVQSIDSLYQTNNFDGHITINIWRESD